MKWGLVVPLALRNLMRNRQRNILSGVAIVASVFALTMGNGLIDGLDEATIRSTEESISGQILLQPQDYPDDKRRYPLADAQPLTPALQSWLEQENISHWTSRLFFRARLIHGADALRIKVLAYDPQKDPTVFSRDRWKMEGAWPTQPNQLVIGSGLAQVMKLKKEDMNNFRNNIKNKKGKKN